MKMTPMMAAILCLEIIINNIVDIMMFCEFKDLKIT